MSGLVRARAPAGGATNAPRSFASPASIAPVGLEMAAEGDGSEEAPDPRKERAQQTGSIRLPLKRRHLGGIVVAAVAGCGLILVAAVIARVSHASNQPTPPAALSAVLSTATNDFKPMLPPSPPRATAPASTPAPSDAATTGTVRLQHPATAGRVWIDGKKLTSTSALVNCGAHQIKVGAWGRARSVQIPCGGEIVVSK
jgi:hypothetical protein